MIRHKHPLVGKKVYIYDGWNHPSLRELNPNFDPINNPDHKLYPQFYKYLPKHQGIIQGESRDGTCYLVIKTYPSITKTKEAINKEFLRIIPDSEGGLKCSAEEINSCP